MTIISKITEDSPVSLIEGQNILVTTSGGLFTPNDIAIDAGGTGNHSIVIQGSVYGSFGVNLDGTHVDFINAGLVAGKSEGLDIDADDVQVTNSGTITGNYGVYIRAATTIQNSGSIVGATVGIIVGDGPTTIINSGLISGDSYSVDAIGEDRLILRNAGTLNGDVKLSEGNGNVYDGRNGTIAGIVIGGGGADKIMAGNDGEELVGNGGHDRLYGGAGADTFDFASFSSADSDLLIGFDARNDTIKLAQNVFTHLKTDVTPTFAIGTKATSATDFLFYNSGTGNLYYDVDGNKTAHTPFLVATLGKGLALTASNFRVTYTLDE